MVGAKDAVQDEDGLLGVVEGRLAGPAREAKVGERLVRETHRLVGRPVALLSQPQPPQAQPQGFVHGPEKARRRGVMWGGARVEAFVRVYVGTYCRYVIAGSRSR